MRDVGDFLFVADALLDPHVAVIDMRTDSFVERFGRHGRGPGEFLAPSSIRRGPAGSVSVWVHDFSNRRLSLAVLQDGAIELTRHVPLAIATSAEDPVPLNKGWIAAGLYGDEAILIFYDQTGRPTTKVGVPPFQREGMGHPIGLRLLNRTTMAPHPALSKFAVAFYSANRLDIYGSNGRLIRSVSGPRDVQVRFHVARNRFFWDSGNELAYTALAASSAAILALSCECPLGGDVGNTRRVVHAWTWDGEFIGQYSLGDDPVYRIVTSVDGARLFGAVESPYPRIVVWELPAELRP